MARLSFALVAALLVVCLGNAEARTGVGAGEQDWGYVDVRSGAHMFWWLYYTTNKNVASAYEKPLVIWLQGGPGASSTGYGNFEELGPYDLNLNPRNYTWVKEYNVLFIDNPVGTGFSYADSTAALTKTNAQIAADLLELMRGFYKELPQFRKVPVYITSESYGGKMAAEFALIWYKAEKAGAIESNLKGVGLGDSWISPIDSVLTWAPFLLQTGMIDTQGYKKIEKAANRTRDLVNAGKWVQATNAWGATENVINNVAVNIDFYNILSKVAGFSKGARSFKNAESANMAMLRESMARSFDDDKLERLMNGQVKQTLGLGVNWGAQSGAVFSILSADFMKPVTKIVDRLLEETDLKVFVYTGQLDLIVDTPGTLLWVENLNWKNINQWKTSPRTAVVVDGIIEGYRKVYGNLYFYWMNRAGHMVPADNPAATSYMLKDMTKN